MKFWKAFTHKSMLGSNLLDPEVCCSHIWSAADKALRVDVEELLNLLKYAAENTPRSAKPSRHKEGKFPANFPLAMACLFDQIVVRERQAGRGNVVEQALGRQLHDLIFKHWVMGFVPGSKFLMNLLVLWESSGFFEDEYLQSHRAALLPLAVGPGADGVPDPPHKDQCTGWYRVIQRSGINGTSVSATPDATRKLMLNGTLNSNGTDGSARGSAEAPGHSSQGVQPFLPLAAVKTQ